MAFPEESLRQEALLCLIYYRGFRGHSDYRLAARETYRPLAEFFGLSQADLARLAGDQRRSAWEINIQGTRERLAQRGYVQRPPPHGIWKLTSEGVEKARSLASSYAELLPHSESETPRARDLSQPPEPTRVLSQTYRILRDTSLARQIKALYRHRCQLCGSTICLRDRAYVEAHHLRPLGPPHNGPDVAENIICACPNHHVQLDYGALRLSLGGIEQHPSHVVGIEYVTYHNRVICGG